MKQINKKRLSIKPEGGKPLVQISPKKSASLTENLPKEKRRSRDSLNAIVTNKMVQTFFEHADIPTMVKQLKQCGGLQKNKLFSLIQLCENILKFQPNVLHVYSPVFVIGDIHGQFYDLLHIFQTHGYPDKTRYLFLGDYVDRGLFCVEVMTLLIALKVKYPQNIYLLRGNHQGKVMTMNFNFKLECMKFVDNFQGQKKYCIEAYEKFLLLFCKLPLCAVIDQAYFAVHGGISPQFTKIKQLQKVDRFVQISNHGVVCDLVWSDPSKSLKVDWEPNRMRGCSYYFGAPQTKKFLKENKIKLIIRGHEVQIDGFNYQKGENDEKLTLTIFSAPNYCDAYKNKGALAIIKDNKLSIQKFHEVAHPFVLSNYMDGFEFSMPAVCQLVGKIFLYLLKSKRKSKKQADLVEAHLIEELNALQRVQVINRMLQKQFLDHELLLMENADKQKENKSLSESLLKSYQIFTEVFAKKLQEDHQEMYPDTEVIERIRQRRSTKKKTLILSKSLSSKSLHYFDDEEGEVFGPKLAMRNNICKKKTYTEEILVFEDF